MLRIIDGTPYLGKTADYVKLQARDLGHGHLEITGYRPIVWHEADWPDDYVRDVLDVMASAQRDEAEHRQKMAEKAAARARRNIRQLCKAQGVDTLLTLTYRANQSDLALCKKHLKEFVRRLRRCVPGFAAVAGFERQKRGAWHVHLACRGFDAVLSYRGAKVKSYNVIRAIWRGVVGELGGNIDVQRRKRNSQRSPAKIAAYIAKYITKDYADGELWSNRWTRFGGAPVPPKVDLGFFASMNDALGAAYGLVPDASRIVSARISRFADSFFIFSEGRTIERGCKDF